MSHLSLFLRAAYAAIACTVFVASMPAYLKRMSFVVHFLGRKPKLCEYCEEEHSRNEALIFAAIETARVLLSAAGWFFYFAGAMLDRIEGRK